MFSTTGCGDWWDRDVPAEEVPAKTAGVVAFVGVGVAAAVVLAAEGATAIAGAFGDGLEESAAAATVGVVAAVTGLAEAVAEDDEEAGPAWSLSDGILCGDLRIGPSLLSLLPRHCAAPAAAPRVMSAMRVR